jgi:hypothetical protein
MKEAIANQRPSIAPSKSGSSTSVNSQPRNKSIPTPLPAENVFRNAMASMSFTTDDVQDDDMDYVAPALTVTRRASVKSDSGAATRRQSLKAGLNILDSFNEPTDIVSSDSKEKLGWSSQFLAPSIKPSVRGSLAALNGSLNSSMGVGFNQPAADVEEAKLTGDQREEIKVL